jgi:hypothetical protein
LASICIVLVAFNLWDLLYRRLLVFVFSEIVAGDFRRAAFSSAWTNSFQLDPEIRKNNFRWIFSTAAKPFSNVFGASLITFLIVTYGWKLMSVIIGAFGIVWVIVWALLFTDFPETSKFVSDSELAYIREGQVVEGGDRATVIRTNTKKKEQFKTSWRYLLLDPAMLSNNIGFFIQGFSSNFALNWFPKYLTKTFKLSLLEVGSRLVFTWIVIGVMVSLSGYISDLLWR